jgi:hypothetical protein
MKVTIEQDELVYMYLLNRKSEFGMLDVTLPYIDGYLIYDFNGHWIGIQLEKRGEYANDFESFEFIDEMCPLSNIITTKEFVSIRFNNDEHENEYFVNQDFNIDLIGNKVFGIELIAWENNDLRRRKIPKEMIDYEK